MIIWSLLERSYNQNLNCDVLHLTFQQKINFSYASQFNTETTALTLVKINTRQICSSPSLLWVGWNFHENMNFHDD